MKYYVNENCIGCGMCNGICPGVFGMTDEGVAMAIDEEVKEADASDAENAMNSCPVGAICRKQAYDKKVI